MSLFNKNQGKLGEDAAVLYLKKLGFTILDRNYLIRGGEIDIVAIERDEDRVETLVFVEVKTRASSDFGTPLESITPWKLRALVKAAQYYKLRHDNLPDAMRIDAIAVELKEDNSISTIELVKNIS